MSQKYRARMADEELDLRLIAGAVLIKGPKWCGKTWTAKQRANSFLLMDDPEYKQQNIALANNSPKTALAGATPRLIDEWQLAPKLWDAVRFEVDQRGLPSQFILTGSAVPFDMTAVDHSGTGRIASLLMRPMSLFESGDSSGSVSLSGLFAQPEQITGTSDLNLERLAFLTCRGGWPKAVDYNSNKALTLAKTYYEGLIENDIMRVDGIRRSRNIANRILRSYARFQAQQVSLENIRKDTAAGDGTSLGIDTVYDYVEALRKLFIIEDSPAWNPNLRSKAAIRTSDTRYFVDPSIATQALGVSPRDLIQDLRTFGFLFETLCIRDLRVYADVKGKSVSHYRDSNGLECDSVIHSQDGEYGLIEIKLGSDDESINQAVKTLHDMEKVIDDEVMSKPSFLMILVGNGPYAYRREDGIYVVPVGCLRE